ncbi:hypothetical protein M3Y98_01052300 [Aphelenchoides besseyi]|nr:hypothetical protein M3Y98_01052300 [Aphelenchoides besseyi]KAI6209785.1 hypothetical protein M3Y96_00257600 [Aphelenchoides besseyi]
MFSWLTYGVNATILFWTGATFFACTTAVSLSVFFLLLDRCFILIGPKWLNNRSKRRLYKVNALFVAANAIIVLVLFIAFEKADIEDTKCQTFSCVTVGKARTLNIIRMFYGSLNTILASVFAVLLYRYNRSNHSLSYSSSSRSNIIAGINVLSQILFNFLPNLAAFIALGCFGVALSSSSGPVVSTFSQIDALCTTIVYLKVVGERMLRKKFTSSVMPTTVIISRY